MSELSSEQGKEIVRSFPNQTGGGSEQEIVGIITDQDEALNFLEWLMSPEAREIGRRIREKQERNNL